MPAGHGLIQFVMDIHGTSGDVLMWFNMSMRGTVGWCVRVLAGAPGSRDGDDLRVVMACACKRIAAI